MQSFGWGEAMDIKVGETRMFLITYGASLVNINSVSMHLNKCNNPIQANIEKGQDKLSRVRLSRFALLDENPTSQLRMPCE